MKDYLGTPAIAKLLNVGADKVRKWIKEGKLPSYGVKSGLGQFRVKLEDFEIFRESLKEPEKEKIPSDLLAYFAGLIDGDGCIRIKKSVGKQMVNKAYRAVLQVKMINEDVIKFLATTLGGTYRPTRPSSINGRQLYYWSVGDAKAESILKDIMPYLGIKKEQAETVIKLRDLQKKSRQFRTKDYKEFDLPSLYGKSHKVKTKILSDEYIMACETLYQRCANLNSSVCNQDISDIYSNYTTKHRFAYIAGIIDAEGSLMIKKRYPKSAGHVSPSYMVEILIGMSDPQPLIFVMNQMHRNGCYYQREDLKSGKPYYCYRAQNQIAENLIRQILPYLIVKKEQAELLLEFRELQSKSQNYRTKRAKIRGNILSDEYLNLCEEFRFRSQQLNRVGI